MNPFERYAAEAHALAADVTTVVREQVTEAVVSVEATFHPVSAPSVSPQPEAAAPVADVDTPAAGAPVGGPPSADLHPSVSAIKDRIEAKADDVAHVAAEVASTAVPLVEHQVTDETHEAENPESSHEDSATVTAAPEAAPAPATAKVPSTAENRWFDLGSAGVGVHYESKTGQQFVLTAPAKRQVQFARRVDTSSITDAASAQAVISKVPGNRLTFRYV